MLVFVDSSFFKALIDKKDDFHNQANSISDTLDLQKAHLMTSNYIVDETATLIRVKCNIELVHDFIEILTQVKRFKVTRINGHDEQIAWTWFWKPWKHLSFTDCTSFALMKRFDITHVATFDHHFSLAGFTVEK